MTCPNMDHKIGGRCSIDNDCSKCDGELMEKRITDAQSRLVEEVMLRKECSCCE